MASKNNIDNLFKEGLGNQRSEFDINAWSNMEGLLDERDQKKTLWNFKNILGLGMAVITLTAGSYLFINKDAGISENILVSKSTEINNTSTEEATTNNSSEFISTEVNDSKSESFTPNSFEDTNLENEIVQSSETISENESNLVANSLEAKQSDPSQKSIQSIKQFENDLAVIQLKNDNSYKNLITNSVFPAEEKNLNTTEQNNTAKNSNVSEFQSSVNNDIAINNQELNSNIKHEDIIEPKTDEDELAVLVSFANQNVEQTLNTDINTESLNSYQINSIEEENQFDNSEILASNTIIIPPYNDGEKSISMMPFQNATPIFINEEKKEIVKIKEKKEKTAPTRDWLNPLRKANLGLIAGGGLNRGYINNSAEGAGISITPVIGLRTSFLLNENVSIDLNLLYHNQGSLNSSLDNVGENGETISSNFKSLHYLSLPLYINYKTARGGILIGIRFAKLMTVKNEIIADKIENGNVSQQTNTYWGIDNSFSSSDLSVSVGYQYLLNERISLGTRLYYGLYDVTDNASFRNSVRDNNLELHFTLDFTIFKY